MSTWVKKLRAVAILLAVTIALSPVAAAYPQSAPLGTVNGYVKSAMTGAALSDVTVRVFDMNTAEVVAEVVTSTTGTLELAELPFGLYQITVVAPVGYVSAAGPLVSLNAEHREATVGFNLEALPGAAAPAQRFEIPWWGFVVAGAAVLAVTATAFAMGDDEPGPPVGTG